MGYKLWLKFNSYTGDFESELLAFMFGIQHKGDIDYQEFVDDFNQNADKPLMSLRKKLHFTKYNYNDIKFEKCTKIAPYPLGTKYDCDGIYFVISEKPTKFEMISFLNRAEQFSSFFNANTILPNKYLQCNGFLVQEIKEQDKEDEGM